MNIYSIVVSEESIKESVITIETDKNFEEVSKLCDELQGYNKDHEKTVLDLLSKGIKIANIDIINDEKELEISELERVEDEDE